MTKLVSNMTKTIVGTAAAAALAVSATAPAQARDRDGIGAGEVIAGAVVLGGLAAILASADNDKDYRGKDYRGNHYRGDDYRGKDYRSDDYRGDDYRGDISYDRDGYRGEYRGNYRHGQGAYGGKQAINACVTAAERRGTRRFGWADVTEIRDVDRTRYGYRVQGRILVKNDTYGRGYGKGYGRGYRDTYDRGRFTCYFDGYGRPQLEFSGLDSGRHW